METLPVTGNKIMRLNSLYFFVHRTVHFGTPKPFEKEAFTRVLKGQIGLASAVFPNKIIGNCLDSFARKYLWDVGLDYNHGTGHGVGSYLCVHEGPMGISWRPYPDDPGLQVGFLNKYWTDKIDFAYVFNFQLVRVLPSLSVPWLWRASRC